MSSTPSGTDPNLIEATFDYPHYSVEYNSTRNQYTIIFKDSVSVGITPQNTRIIDPEIVTEAKRFVEILKKQNLVNREAAIDNTPDGDYHVKETAIAPDAMKTKNQKEVIPMTKPATDTALSAETAQAPTLAKRAMTQGSKVAVEAAKRTACRKVVKTAQAALIDILTQGSDPSQLESMRAVIARNLESEKGKIIVGGALGLALPLSRNVVPEKYHRYVDIVSDELQIESAAVAGGMVTDFMTGPMLGALVRTLTEAFSKMDEAEQQETKALEASKVRVDTSTANKTEEHPQEVTNGKQVTNGFNVAGRS